MKQILSEYGSTVIAAIVFALIIAIGFSIVFFGTNSGLISAAGAASPVTGNSDAGLSQSDNIIAVNEATYEITKNTSEIKVGEKTLLSGILTSTDDTAVFSVTSVTDEKRDDCLLTGVAEYDRTDHSITITERGLYTVQVRASGKQLQRYTFVIYAQ